MSKIHTYLRVIITLLSVSSFLIALRKIFNLSFIKDKMMITIEGKTP